MSNELEEYSSMNRSRVTAITDKEDTRSGS